MSENRVADIDAMMSKLGFKFAHLRYNKMTHRYVRVYSVTEDGDLKVELDITTARQTSLDTMREHLIDQLKEHGYA